MPVRELLGISAGNYLRKIPCPAHRFWITSRCATYDGQTMRHLSLTVFSLIALLTGCPKSDAPNTVPEVNASAIASSTGTVASGSTVAIPAIPAASSAAVTTAHAPLSVELASAGKCEGSGPPSHAAKPALTAQASGADVKVTVNDVTDYCATNATYDVRREGDTIHIVRGKPSTVSRCVCTHDVAFVVHGAGPGSSKIVFEQVAYGSDAGAALVASGSVKLP